MELQVAPSSQTVVKKENRIGGLKLPSFKSYYKVTETEGVWYWHKNRNTSHWNKIQSQEVNSCICGQVIFYVVLNLFSEERTVPSIYVPGQLYFYMQTNLDPYFIPYKTIYSKWINLHIRAITIELLEENLGVSIHDHGMDS